jgi:hypothetical protein
MANPFTGIAQMGVNDFWGLLQQLQSLGNQLKADLDADRSDLIDLYNTARSQPDPAVAQAQMSALDPLVHNNSSRRLQYQDLVTKFNQAVNGASGLLNDAGLSTPTLSGLGIAPLVLVAGAALLVAAAAWGVYEAVRAATDAQRNSTNAMQQIIANPTAYTPAEVQSAAAALAAQARNVNPDPFNLNALIPILGLVAAILLVPKILELLPKRRAA